MSTGRAADRFALIANPGSARALGFAAACHSHGFPEPVLVPWEEVLSPGFDPRKRLAGATALRLETPAGHPQVERLILARGARPPLAHHHYHEPHRTYLSPEECLALPDDAGELRCQHQWYHGFHGIQEEISAWTRELGLRVMNDPADIAKLFDKLQTREILEASDVPLAPGAWHCMGFEHLRVKMDAYRWDRVFLKPRHGSSAAGVMAISRTSGNRWQAVTSARLEISGGVQRIWNSKRPLRLSSLDDIRATVNAVCQQNATLERWFPKATLDGRPFDLRIVVIAGQAAHIAVRTSSSPITNLHLRNQRGDLQQVIAKLGPTAWAQALATAEAAAACFPSCHYCGVDLMIGARSHRSVVAEVNAFGDHLHREQWQDMDPWEAELALWASAG
ncbi:STM4014 family protein [Luteolibacter sp. Populi]|uniref:STM4014 family protein n=1 Tax=Luteolibacter sp. Populi TaxID=3230487 RepID=UPI0034659EAC